MKIKNIATILLVSFILVSCTPAAIVVPTKTTVPTSTFMPIRTSTMIPTYAYLPTITPIPSSTSFVISPTSASPTLKSQQSQANYDNAFSVTIGEESFFVEGDHAPVYYRVLLNFKNSSEEEIKDVNFFLVTYKSKDFKVIPNLPKFKDFWINVLGTNENRNAIPVGESHIVIDVNIYVNGNYFQCKDGSLEKPLYLLLFFGSMGNGNTDNPLKVSNDLNQKILEIPCKFP